MKRTTLSPNEKHVLNSLLLERAKVAALLGYQYGGKRNIYDVMGYERVLSFDDFLTKYARQDIARAIIDRPVSKTWQGDLRIIETNDKDETPLELAFEEMSESLKLRSVFTRVDKLTGIGHYGVLLFGFNDTFNPQVWAQPVKKSSSLKLLYVRPLSEKSCVIKEYVQDTQDPRFGKPLYYSVKLSHSDINTGASFQVELTVHYSRIMHIVDSPLESEISGSPRLEVLFNRLTDLEKLVGGSAEMFWRGARPGFSGNIDKDMVLGPAEKEALETQMDEYENDFRRLLINKGIDLKALQSQVTDPKNHVDIQFQMISAVTGIPKRILTGSERGELASSQDKGEWLEYIQNRREEYAEPIIVKPFVDKCIELGVLPAPVSKKKKGRYTVQWDELYSLSDKEKSEIGKNRAEIFKTYISTPGAEEEMPFEAFLKLLMGLDQDQIDLIITMREAQQLDLLAEEAKMEQLETAPVDQPVPSVEDQPVQMRRTK